MATKLFLRDAKTNAIGVFRDLSTTAGGGTAPLGEISTTASGTEIQWKDNGQTELLEWISGRAPSGGFTLSGTMTFSIWARENNMNANCGARSKVFKRTAAGVETLIGGPYNDGVEFGTSAAEMVWTGTPTSTAFAENDRLIVRYYITNVGTMAGGFVCSLDYGAPDATTGDSFFQINENVTFKAEDVPAITGTMDVTEAGEDDFTAAGTVPVAGSLAATEAGADDFTADGTVTEAGITGTLAATESGADDVTASGTVAVSGTLSATESGADDATASGAVVVQGVLAATEAGTDDATISGAVAVAGLLAATETGSDDFTGSGSTIAEGISGTLAATETGADDFTGSGLIVVQGSLSASEVGSDVFAGSGMVPVQGTAAAVESGADDFAGLGALAILGAFAAVETGSDSFSAAGSTTGGVSGSFSAVEAGSDDFTASGQIVLSGALAASETGSDGFAGAGTVSDPGLDEIIGAMAAIESGSDLFVSPTINIPVPQARHTQVSPRVQIYPPANTDAGMVAGASRTTVVPKRSA
jgi:hypothetical protein